MCCVSIGGRYGGDELPHRPPWRLRFHGTSAAHPPAVHDCCTRVRPLLSCATLHRHPLIVKCHMHVQGACCMLGGMTRMTISLCVILMETTNNIQCALLAFR